MSATTIQTWVAIVGALLTAIVGLLRFFSYRSKRDRMTTIGSAFSTTVTALSSDSDLERMAAAVLLRRFLEPGTEQGGRRPPYKKEAVEVIASVLRRTPHHDGGAEASQFQKAIADGLRYAQDLRSADLQRCNLREAYLGRRKGDRRRLLLSNADLYQADCSGASFREVVARGTAFFHANLSRAVFVGADLTSADFRQAQLAGARFGGATIEGARFAGAADIPAEVVDLLDEDFTGRRHARVPGDGS